jgi:hypothetical protein
LVGSYGEIYEQPWSAGAIVRSGFRPFKFFPAEKPLTEEEN